MTARVQSGLRLLLGGLLLWAAVVKVLEPRMFFFALLEYRLGLPDGVLRFVAATLPWLEAVCGAMLLANRWERATRALAVVLTLGFVLATGQAWARGLEISCGCFGAREDGFWGTAPAALARALVLFGVAGWLLWETKRAPSAGAR